MSRPNLNEKQQAVYHCIINAMAEGLPPTVREICAATGIKSTSTVHAVLKKLEEAGYITRGAGSSRTEPSVCIKCNRCEENFASEVMIRLPHMDLPETE